MLLSQANCNVLFADDTNVFISGNNLRRLINTLHIELDKLYAWLQSNKLTLNLLKTHYIVFHRAKHKHMDVKRIVLYCLMISICSREFFLEGYGF